MGRSGLRVELGMTAVPTLYRFRAAEEPAGTTFITQEPESVLPSNPRWLPDIQTKT